jgi:hypothetical protein
VPNSGRSRLREKAVMALLEHSTIEKAALATGIGLRTLKRWLTDATFKEALRKATNDVHAEANRKLRMAQLGAVEVLISIANNRRASYAARVTASRTLLEGSFEAQAAEDFDVRLEKLEESNKNDF